MPAAGTKSNTNHDARPVEAGTGQLPEFVLRNSKEFLAGFDHSQPRGGVFCPTRRKVPTGTLVAVRVRFGRRQPAVVLYGRVAWRRPGRHLEKIRAGVGVEFLEGERAKCDYLLQVARGGDNPRSRRRHERIRVDLPVRWRLEGATDGLQGQLMDVGRGGAFVRTQEPVNGRDTHVVLEIAPPGAEVPMAFTARIAWTGSNGEQTGFGVEWRARDAGGGRRIKELVRRLSAVSAPIH